MEHAPPDCQYGHKEIAAFTDLSAVGPDPLDELAGHIMRTDVERHWDPRFKCASRNPPAQNR